MEKNYIEKIQGDGSLSWVCIETENGKTINKYMVYKDPFIDKNKIDLIALFTNATPEELAFIKSKLK